MQDFGGSVGGILPPFLKSWSEAINPVIPLIFLEIILEKDCQTDPFCKRIAKSAKP